MPHSTKPAIQHRIQEFRKGNNAYTFHALEIFLDKKFAEIDFLAKDYFFEESDIEQLQHDIITLLENIDFMRAYALKHIKTRNKQDDNIDPNSLEKFIYNADKRLLNIPELVRQQSKNSTSIREDHLDKVTAVRDIINHYNKDNKKGLLNDFNNQIDKLYFYLSNLPHKKIEAEIEVGLHSLLDNLQKNEHSYYDQLRFFTQSRKSNSSLQPAINEAKDYLFNCKILSCKVSLTNS